MTDQWVVVLNTGAELRCYGPTDDENTARSFAEYLKAEVDPATVHPLMSMTSELLAFWRNSHRPSVVKKPSLYPVDWPPKPGDIWQDRNGDRWACSDFGPPQHSYLFCLAHRGDDSAEEIWRAFGPLTRVMFVPTNEEEPPF